MLYDVFISHASEDRDDFVGRLAQALRESRLEVWFDQFTLTVGMSLRSSIDRGLAKSRFGIVVLSPSFFGKSWPEWELNGLVQRHLAGKSAVILPIWHNVSHADVARYSPPLADIVAVRSDKDLSSVVDQLLTVIRPEGSALISARDILIGYGFEPPVISDDWWLDVIEGTGSQDQRRWCLPVWRMTNRVINRGEELAWTVMQHLWQEQAELRPISQITPPADMTEFIERQPGLLVIGREMPEILIEHAPQISIPGFGGVLEGVIENAYQQSIAEQAARRARNDPSGSGLTTDGHCPACDDCFALRHPTFGNYRPGSVACGFVQGNGAGFGPSVKAFETIDYLVWFLSSDSHWLPRTHWAYLFEGMKQWASWPWWGETSECDYSGEHAGSLYKLLIEADEEGRAKTFAISKEALIDIKHRIAYSRSLLSLSDATDDLVHGFLKHRIPQSWFTAQDRRRRKKRVRTPKRG